MEELPLFARQSIFDKDNKVAAFEFLYRGDTLQQGKKLSQQTATLELLTNICTNILDEDLNLGCPILINVDEDFLLSDAFFKMPPANIVFELLETIEPTEAVMTKLAQLKKQGFTLALDDYLFEKSKTPFFKYVDIVKVDVLDIEWQGIESKLEAIRQAGCTLLAEKVEDQAMFDRCHALGFDLFQGFYLEKPIQVPGKVIEPEQRAVLQLVSELTRDDIETDEVAELISHDPVLTVKVLKLINCPLYQLVREVSSVRDAVVILGLEVVKQWATILSLVSASSCPKELFRTLLIRAKTLSLIGLNEAQHGVKVDSSECFLIGMLSGTDAIFQTELSTILQNLKLKPQMRKALESKDNDLGRLLISAIGLERFDDSVFEQLSDRQILVFNRCYRKALTWADQVLEFL